MTREMHMVRIAMGLSTPDWCVECKFRHPDHPGWGCMYYPDDPNRGAPSCVAVMECLKVWHGQFAESGEYISTVPLYWESRP